MNKINWQNGTLVSPAKVEIGGVIYEVTPEQYSGNTPLSAENLNQMQDNIEEAIPEVIDNLTSSSTSKALSANQGKELKTYIEELNTYSTTEKIVGTWINGKPLYEKTITGTKIAGTDLSIKIADDVEYGFVVGGTMMSASGRIYSVLDRYQDSSIFVRTSIHNNYLEVSSGSNASYSNGNIVAIVRYTKTTD